MNNYQTWLETPSVIRIMLVQAQVLVDSVITTRYLSTHAITVDAVEYLPVIRGSLNIEESISTEYLASISYGDIELINSRGQYDSWLNDVWVNKSVKIYVGSLPIPGYLSVIEDFELIFDGVVSDIDSKNRTQLNLKIRDKLEKLNTSVSEDLIGNYFQGSIVPQTTVVNQYQNNLKPLVFGEVHNITPILTDPTLLEYMVSAGPVEQILEVRDSGMPIAFATSGTISIPPGSFRLLQSPSGTITCSVQGIKKTIDINNSSTSNIYTNTVSNTISTILKLYGKQLGYSEIDQTSFLNLGSEAVGIYLKDRVNVLNLCQQIAKSSGLILSTTRTGKVKLIDLTIPTTSSISISENDTVLNSLELTQKLDVIAGVRLGYAQNWTVQTNLLTAIPEQHKDLYAKEWLELTQIDTTASDKYSVTTEPEMQTSYLIDSLEVAAVALKKLNLFKAQRKIYSMKCTAKFLSVQIGDIVNLKASRFGLNTGVNGIVVSTKPDWLRGTIEIRVLT